MSPSVLLITHDALLAKAYAARLRRADMRVAHGATAYEGLAMARHDPPSLIMLDLTLPGLHGLDVLKWLRDVPWLSQVPVIVLAERAMRGDVLDECRFWGATHILRKDEAPMAGLVELARDVLAHAPVPEPDQDSDGAPAPEPDSEPSETAA
ncbi:MAG TPA: response regulator [bacterium]